MTETQKKELSALVASAAGGDGAARETIYRRFYDTIFCFIYKITKSTPDAEDLAQETFIRLYRKDFSENVWTNGYVYIFQIAKNLCLDLFRRQKRRENLFEKVLDRTLASDGEEPADYGFIGRALTEDEERLVFLRYGSGYNLYEISDLTKIPQRTLERRFNAIRDKVRAAAENAGYKNEQ